MDGAMLSTGGASVHPHLIRVSLGQPES